MQVRNDSTPTYLSFLICYEYIFLWLCTHLKCYFYHFSFHMKQSKINLILTILIIKNFLHKSVFMLSRT